MNSQTDSEPDEALRVLIPSPTQTGLLTRILIFVIIGFGVMIGM